VGERRIAGRFVLRERLGDSSWRAADEELGRDVLVRLAPPGGRAAPLSHPNVAGVFDHGVEDGVRYEVREFLPGGSLAEQGAASLSAPAAHAVAHEVASALAHAHAHGIAHGRLSERVILFDAEGRAKVADFSGEGDPREDVLAFGAILQSLADAAPALGGVAAAALGGELGSAQLMARLEQVAPVAAAPEPTTAVESPPVADRSRRRSLVAGFAVAAILLASGVGAAFLATGRSAPEEPERDPSSGLKATSASTAGAATSAPAPTEAPPPSTSGTTATGTTESTTTATTTARTSTTRTTTPAPPVPTEPLPPTVELPPTEPPPTEPLPTDPPPTVTEEPPPPTEPTTTGVTQG
jgi:hypothetical protein